MDSSLISIVVHACLVHVAGINTPWAVHAPYIVWNIGPWTTCVGDGAISVICWYLLMFTDKDR